MAELEGRGILRLTARQILESLPADFPLLDALDFAYAQATASCSRVRNVPGFLVSFLQSGMRPPANWETRAQKAAREKDEAERAEFAARQMNFDLQLEQALEAKTEQTVETLKSAEPDKFAELWREAKNAIARDDASARRVFEWEPSNRAYDPHILSRIKHEIRTELYLAHVAGSAPLGTAQL